MSESERGGAKEAMRQEMEQKLEELRASREREFPEMDGLARAFEQASTAFDAFLADHERRGRTLESNKQYSAEQLKQFALERIPGYQTLQQIRSVCARITGDYTASYSPVDVGQAVQAAGSLKEALAEIAKQGATEELEEKQISAIQSEYALRTAIANMSSEPEKLGAFLTLQASIAEAEQKMRELK